MLGTLQALRAFAAISVVVYHSGYLVFGVHTDLGGVTLFFVISGFISCHIPEKDQNRNAARFLLRRIKRILPLYWLATFVLLACTGSLFTLPWQHIVLSLLFIPHDGKYGAFPVLGVGWTLNIEMACYVLFATAMWLLPKAAPLLAAAAILSARWLVTSTFPEASSATHHASSLYAEAFVAGILVWLIWSRCSDRIKNWRLPKWLFPLTITSYAIIMIVWSNAAQEWPDLYFRASVIAMTVILTIVSVVSASAGADVQHPWIMTLGGASYALYLVHTIVQSIGHRNGLVVDGPFVAALYVCVCVGLSLAIYRWIEPVLARLVAANPQAAGVVKPEAKGQTG